MHVNVWPARCRDRDRTELRLQYWSQSGSVSLSSASLSQELWESHWTQIQHNMKSHNTHYTVIYFVPQCSALFLLDSSYFYCIYALFYNMQCHAHMYKCDNHRQSVSPPPDVRHVLVKLRELHLKIITFMLVIILCQNVWILMETALFVQINQKNWYIFSMNVTIPKVLERLIPVCPRKTGYVCDLNSKMFYFESKKHIR